MGAVLVGLEDTGARGFELVDCEKSEGAVHFLAADFDAEIHGRNQVFWWKRLSILSLLGRMDLAQKIRQLLFGAVLDRSQLDL